MPSANSESNKPTRVLPLWAVLREACLFPWHHRRHVGCLLIVPASLSIILMILDPFWRMGEDTSIAGTALQFSFPLLHFAVFTFFAVSYHRLILIGKHAVSWFGVPGWTLRETRFFLWLIAIYVIAYIFMIVVGAAVAFLSLTIGGMMGDLLRVMEHPAFFYILALAFLVPFAYVVGRMSLVLPAVAIDLRPSLNWAMSLSRRNGWRVALLVGGTPFVFAGLYLMMLWSVGGLPEITGEGTAFKPDFRSATMYGLQPLVHYAWLTIEVAILSISFRKLSRSDGTTAPSQTFP